VWGSLTRTAEDTVGVIGGEVTFETVGSDSFIVPVQYGRGAASIDERAD